MAISLFEKRQLNHVCYASEEDVTRELLTLLELARTAYREEGVPDKKSVERFIEDFVNEQWYIDCDSTCCRNLHRRNINIVGGILARRDLLKRLVEMENFTLEECEKILHLYNTSAPPPVLCYTGMADATRAFSPTNTTDAPPSTRQDGTPDVPPSSPTLRTANVSRGISPAGTPCAPPSSHTTDTTESAQSSQYTNTSDSSPTSRHIGTADAQPSTRLTSMADVSRGITPTGTADAPPSTYPTGTPSSADGTRGISPIGTSDTASSTLQTGTPDTIPPPLSFGCTLTEEQMLHLSQHESMEHLFCIKENETLDLRSLLHCKDGCRLKVRNPQLVALFFDTLCNEGKIRWDWKIIMERGGFLVSKKGKTISASALAVNLHRAIMGSNPDAEKYKSEWLYCLRTSTFIRK